MLADLDWIRNKYIELRPLFGNRMPEVSFKTTTSLDKFGVAGCTIYAGDDNVIRSKDFTLRMSNAYESPEEMKINILLHEMIHIYDYYNFPEHFARITPHGKLVKREYDAHGQDLFIPMAQMLNSKGYNVGKYVSDSDMETAVMSDTVKNRMGKPFLLCYAKYADESQNMVFICTERTLSNIERHYKSAEWNRFAPNELSAYETVNPSLRKNWGMTKGEFIRGYRMPEQKWHELLGMLKLSVKQPDRTIYFKNGKAKMNENRKKRIIRLTEADIRKAISEALEEVVADDQAGPVDGGDAAGRQITPSAISFSVV